MHTIGNYDERDDEFIAERDDQLALFHLFLSEEPSDDKRIWSIYGTAGTGKSFLLDAYRRLAERSGARMLLLDSRDFNHTAEQFCQRLLRQMKGGQAEAERGPDRQGDALDTCLHELRRISEAAKVVIALDTYEEMGELDGWLREQFCKRLPPRVLFLIAGRYKLKDQWIVTPALRERIRYMPLDNLSRTACGVYLQRLGMTDDEQISRIWHKTRGHPLALSLAAFVDAQADWTNGSADEAEWFEQLAKAWLREVPDAQLRQLVEAAAVLLHVNREVLQFIMDKEIDDESFERLIALSFVRRTNRGWMLHDLVRGTMRKQLEERTPVYCERLRGRAAQYFAARIRHSSTYRNTEWEVGELLYYVGGGLVRTSIQAQARGRYAWGPLTMTNVDEGERYLSRRNQAATPLDLVLVDPETDEHYENSEAREDMALAVIDLDLRAWLALDRRSAMLLRSANGEAVGLAVIIPIHAATLPTLSADPFAGPYLASLTPAEYDRLKTAPPDQAGWFIRSIDFVDWGNPDLVIEGMFLMFSYMYAGGLFVTSPPPVPFFDTVHRELGFQDVPGLLHCNYDGRTPTPTFVLDTRGEKLEQFLGLLLRRSGVPLEAETTGGKFDDRLTEREREVVSLVLDGMTNAEIAAELYVSEITVKKHVSSIYNKLAVKGRGQLIKLLVGKSSSA